VSAPRSIRREAADAEIAALRSMVEVAVAEAKAHGKRRPRTGARRSRDPGSVRDIVDVIRQCGLGDGRIDHNDVGKLTSDDKWPEKIKDVRLVTAVVQACYVITRHGRSADPPVALPPGSGRDPEVRALGRRVSAAVERVNALVEEAEAEDAAAPRALVPRPRHPLARFGQRHVLLRRVGLPARTDRSGYRAGDGHREARGPRRSWLAVAPVVLVAAAVAAFVLRDTGDPRPDAVPDPRRPSATAPSPPGPSAEGWLLALSDPLAAPGRWREMSSPDWGARCWFADGALHATGSRLHSGFDCPGPADAMFTDFRLEIRTTISGGGCADIVFRSMGDDLYVAGVCTNGRVYLDRYDADAAGQRFTKVDETFTTVAPEVETVLALLAEGPRIALLLDGRPVLTAEDDGHARGAFYLRLFNGSSPGTVRYRDLRIWTRPGG
jgi:hypothetical protein